MLSINQTIHDVNQANYKLDTLGVAGLLGGENAVDALETIHLYEGRRWAGWYNYPGTVDVAKRFGQMASSRWWDSIFPGPNETPATTFQLAGKSGPDYSGSFSGTKLRTKYLGYLITQDALRPDIAPKELSLLKDDGITPGRRTGSAATIVVISLPPQQLNRIEANDKQNNEFIPVKPKSKSWFLAFASIVPSLFSIAAGVLSIFAHDSLCASLIFLGIICSGFSSLVLGTAALRICVPVPSKNSPPGDGLMFPDNGSIIVLKGAEADVNVVTKGEFELDYSNAKWSDPKFSAIGFSSLFLYAQFLVQLLLVPRCTLFGQILFLISWVVSGGYHLYVASYERENVHWELLSRELSAKMEKWKLGTRTQMAVFTCLVLGDNRENPLKSNPEAVLNRIVPNDTAVWKHWRELVVEELERFWGGASKRYSPSIQVPPNIRNEAGLTEGDKKLLDDLIGDAWCVFKKYPEWRERECKIWERDDAEESFKAYRLSGGSLA